ncbi:hypothetical protein BC831DRAFT_488531 [Entophlyctis helioformis]|nr:hypothetical protein BC831DRAFT_488531 [Entophlyctis helioformis]
MATTLNLTQLGSKAAGGGDAAACATGAIASETGSDNTPADNVRVKLRDAAQHSQPLEAVFLGSNGLQQLPTELQLVSNSLRILDASFNSLADIPSRLASLTQLLLSLNAIADIHESSFSGLVHLDTLDLCGNRLQHLPRSLLASCCSLQRLDVSNNLLSGLDLAVPPSCRLVELHLSHNAIPSVSSACLGRMTSLRHLDLSFNAISVLPCELFGDLHSLRTLLLNDNRLRELPRLQDLISLETMDVRHNRLAVLPACLVQLANLKYLYLFGSDVGEISDDDDDCGGIIDSTAVTSGKQEWNQLVHPPASICRHGLQAIQSFLRKTPSPDVSDTSRSSSSSSLSQGALPASAVAPTIAPAIAPAAEHSDGSATQSIATAHSSTRGLMTCTASTLFNSTHHSTVSDHSHKHGTMQLAGMCDMDMDTQISSLLKVRHLIHPTSAAIVSHHVQSLASSGNQALAHKFLCKWIQGVRDDLFGGPTDFDACVHHLSAATSLASSLLDVPDVPCVDTGPLHDLVGALVRIIARFGRVRLAPYVVPAFLQPGELQPVAARLVGEMRRLVDTIAKHAPLQDMAPRYAIALARMVDTAAWNALVVRVDIEWDAALQCCLAAQSRVMGWLHESLSRGWPADPPPDHVDAVSDVAAMPMVSAIICIDGIIANSIRLISRYTARQAITSGMASNVSALVRSMADTSHTRRCLAQLHARQATKISELALSRLRLDIQWQSIITDTLALCYTLSQFTDTDLLAIILPQ